MAVSRILSPEFLQDDDHLSQSRFRGTARPATAGRDATIPEDFIGPAALPLFCLAPHGVFRAPRITPRAVSSYLAFSPLPARFSQRTGGVFSVTLSVNIRPAAAGRMLPAYFTRHAAVWCSDFPLANLASHQRSSAISKNLS